MSDARVLYEAVARAGARYRGALVALAWLAVAVAIAIARRGEGADDVVVGALGPLVVPLVSFAVAGATLSGRSLRSVTEPLMLLGARRGHAALAPFVVAMLASAALCGVAGAACVGLAREATAPWRDVFTTTWVAALGGASYAAVFVASSSFGKSGGGRNVVLAIDFIVGAGGGLGGALTIRGHLRNLLGGAAPLELGQRASSVALVAFGAIAIAVALRWRSALKPEGIKTLSR